MINVIAESRCRAVESSFFLFFFSFSINSNDFSSAIPLDYKD